MTTQSAYPPASAPLDALRSPEKASYDGNPLPRLRALLQLERRDLWVVVIYSIGVGLMTLVVPVAVQALVNFIAFGSLLQPLVVLTLFVLVALGFSSLMNGFRVLTVEIIQRRLFVRVTTDFAQRLVSARADVFDRLHGPELVNRFFDVVTVQKSAAALLMDGLSLVMQTVLGMALLAVYHPLLLAFDGFLVLVMAAIIFIFGRGAIPSAVKESKAKYVIAAWLEEIAANVAAFKSASGMSYALGRVDRLATEYLDRRKAHFRVVLRQIIGSLALQAIASAALLGIGGFLVMQGQLTLGQLVAAELIVTTVVGGFSKFGKKLETYYDLLAALDKLGQVIDLPLENTGLASPPSGGGAAAVRAVDLEMRSGDPGASLDLPAGSRTAITGASGAGKSALADALCGLRRPRSGVIQFDGLDTRDLSLAGLRDQVVLIRSLDTLSDTIERNVSLGRDDVSLQRVQQVLAEVGLLDEVLAMPGGLQHVLRGGPSPLPAEQSLRVAVARAIASQPRFLVVDGALDRVSDPQTLDQLCSVLLAPSAPWTLLVFTEEPRLLERFDSVLELTPGGLQPPMEVRP